MYETYEFINLIARATIIPGVLIIFWLIGLISFLAVQLCLLIFLVVFVGFPILFRYSVTLQRGILFLTFITYPKDLDLSNPASVGNYATRSFHVNVHDPEADEQSEVRVGVWHVLPRYIAKRFKNELKLDEESFLHPNPVSREVEDEELDRLEPILKAEFPEINDENEKLFYERTLKLPGTVVLYLHGNTASRGSGHRNDIYRILRRLGYHVITMDYRGYGDSDPISPTEEGVVRDAKAVFEYVRNITTNPIIIWGHSLGTGVATHLCALLNHLGDQAPRGVILEAPFTSVRDEIRMHPFARPFKDLPWFDLTIARPMYSNSLRFESDRHIAEFFQPVMILHAEDDYVVPFQLGYKLYRTALDTRHKNWGPIEFHRFDASLQYGHKFLCKAPNLPELVKKFVDKYREQLF